MRHSTGPRQSGAVRRPTSSPSPGWAIMAKRVTLILIAIAALVIAGGGVLLASWQIPAPTKQQEKVIPNDRFAR